jgi:DNA polymerase elongation subunit (family B)
MLQYDVYDKYKDPKGYFIKILNYFTTERLKNKALAKSTGDRYYTDLEQSGKITINSSYGFMGAPGLLFNSPVNAAFVTRKGREILTESIKWAEENDFIIVNADTDSISITHKDGGGLSEDEQQQILSMINSLFPERIKFEHDGYYDVVLVLKAKNYALKQGEKVKIKGSALKASMKEHALQDFITTSIKLLLNDKSSDVLALYNDYAKEITNLKDITRWSSKKTVTDKVLNPERLNEEKVLDAIEGTEYVEGDKIRVYFTTSKSLKLEEKWEKDHDVDTLLNKLHSTVKVFDSVLDIKQFPNYKLKKSKVLLTNLFT